LSVFTGSVQASAERGTFYCFSGLLGRGLLGAGRSLLVVNAVHMLDEHQQLVGITPLLRLAHRAKALALSARCKPLKQAVSQRYGFQ